MKSKLTRLQIFITEDQKKWLRLVSYQKAITMAQIIREAIEEVRKNG